MSVACGCTCACAARAVYCQSGAHARSRVVHVSDFVLVTGDCVVTLLLTARRLAPAFADLHSDTSGWPIGEVVDSKTLRWLRTHTYMVCVLVCVVLHCDT